MTNEITTCELCTEEIYGKYYYNIYSEKDYCTECAFENLMNYETGLIYEDGTDFASMSIDEKNSILDKNHLKATTTEY